MVQFSFSTGWAPVSQSEEAPSKADAVPASAYVPGDAQERQVTREQAQRSERRVYAHGLEKILIDNGVNVSVLVYEGQVGPTPTLMFVGYFSREFVSKALTNGAVLERARDLGFKSVDFFDRGPEGHYQFVLSKAAPLPKCAAYNRLCL